MTENLVPHMTKCYHAGLYIIHANSYEFETSFTDISGSNGLILIKFTQLFQWVT